MFEGSVLTQTIAVAKTRKLEPAALLAVVEVESAGKSMEADGKTPRLLFERHVFYRELAKKFGKDSAQLGRAVNAGLANKTWQPSTQYKDQGTSAKRLDLFKAAAAVDLECAIRSCSWGVGQTMGFLAEELKFKNAIQMYEYVVAGGVPAQVECMIREIERKRLIPKLNGHDWAGFAYGYNGASYKKMAYDTKMARAYAKWSKVALPDVVAPPVKPAVPAEVKPEPQPTIPPQAPEITKSSGGFLAGVTALFATFVAWLNSGQGQLFLLAAMIAIMAVITFFVLRARRERQELQPQVGMLVEIDEEPLASQGA